MIQLPTEGFQEVPEMMRVSGTEERRRLSDAFKAAGDKTTKFR